MRFPDIAAFLNVPSRIVRSLAKTGKLPGRPLKGGWDTSPQELEKWYVGLSGQQWADLVSEGRVDPLAAEIKVRQSIGTGDLVSVLETWAKMGVIRILSSHVEKGGTVRVLVMLCQARKEAKRGMQSLEKSPWSESVREMIAMVYHLHSVIGQEPIEVVLRGQRIVRLAIQDQMAGLPQRDREILRFHLGEYGQRLLTEIQRRRKSKDVF